MPYGGGTQMASGGGRPPHTSVGSGELNDAKVYELSFTLLANETRVFDLDANAFYIDNGPTAIGSVEFQIDECTPMIQCKYGMFFRTRRFTRIRFHNLTGVSQVMHLVYSRNPEFLVVQSRN